MATNSRAPIPAIDADGAPIYLIPTSSCVRFKIDRRDLPLIGSGPFFFNKNGKGRGYVRAAGADNLVMIARVIAGAARGIVVRYRAGDPTNIRRSNLVLGRGRSKRFDAALMDYPEQSMAA